MKKSFTLILVLFAYLSNAQFTWVQRANFPFKRDMPYSFSINDKIYFGGGRDVSGQVYGDMWEFNPQTNVWTQKQSINSGYERYGANAQVINGKAYIVGGMKQNELQDVWEYNPSSDSYTQKSNLPQFFSARQDYSSFVIGSKIYYALGQLPYKNDFVSYDPSSDSWTSLANFPGSARSGSAGFSIGGFGYVGFGNNSSSSLKDLYKYDPTNNTWTQLSNTFTGDARSNPFTFVLNSKAYLIGGKDYYLNNTSFIGNQVWEYSTANNSWVRLTDMPDSLCNGNSAALTKSAFIGLGNRFINSYSLSNNSNHFWEFRNVTGIIDENRKTENNITALFHRDKTLELIFDSPTTSNGTLKIVNLNGQVVQEKTILSETVSEKTNLSILTNGVYIFNYTSNYYSYSSKIIIE
jgi:N-acetylneuraminic acid mutarotase